MKKVCLLLITVISFSTNECHADKRINSLTANEPAILKLNSNDLVR